MLDINWVSIVVHGKWVSIVTQAADPFEFKYWDGIYFDEIRKKKRIINVELKLFEHV